MKLGVGRTVKEILGTIVGVAFLYMIALWPVSLLLEWNFAVGGVVAVVYYGFIVYFGIQDLRSPEAVRYSVLKALRIFLLLLLIVVTLFSVISLVLATYGWAKYEPEGASFYEFIEYYFWTCADVVPGLEVSETLGIKLPVEPKEPIAGLP